MLQRRLDLHQKPVGPIAAARQGNRLDADHFVRSVTE
jgi:hypothetical protein